MKIQKFKYDLDSKVSIYVPSTVNVNEPVDNKQQGYCGYSPAQHNVWRGYCQRRRRRLGKRERRNSRRTCGNSLRFLQVKRPERPFRRSPSDLRNTERRNETGSRNAGDKRPVQIRLAFEALASTIILAKAQQTT